MMSVPIWLMTMLIGIFVGYAARGLVYWRISELNRVALEKARQAAMIELQKKVRRTGAGDARHIAPDASPEADNNTIEIS